MDKKIKLIPGICDTKNRHYLPEKLLDGKTTVNENGNNSQVYPANLKEYRAVLADDIEDVWYEYVPNSYDPEKKTPLVVSMHGGLMTGWGQAVYTSWTLVADREGFIVVFPNAASKRMWMMECDWEKVIETLGQISGDVPLLHKPENHVEDYHDVKKTVKLIEKMKEKYNIDAGRIYMQGMSMGNAMTGQFARYMGSILAGAAGSGCPTNSKLLFDNRHKVINQSGPLDIWQSRLELDKVPPHYREGDHETIRYNLEYWNLVNGCDALPQIGIRDEYNFAFYKGSQGNNVLMDVKNRDHGQTFDDAELVWDYLFSGCYKDESGRLHHSEPRKKWCVDEVNFAVAKDRRKAWVNNGIVELHIPCFFWEKIKYHGLNGNAIVRGSYAYIPVSSLAEIFHMRLKTEENGRVAYLCGAPQIGKIISEEVEEIQFAEGNIACIVNNSVESMYAEAVMKENELCVSLEWFARRFLRLSVSECDGVVYATDHPSRISWHMADLIRTYLI